MSAPCPAQQAHTRESGRLAAWLDYIGALSPRAIELGVERVLRVRRALGLDPRFPIVTVGGTNGKGSTCAMLEAVLQAAGHRLGRYTSPHLLAVNERIRIAGAPVEDHQLCEAFAAVDAARAGTPLTYFEFGTLAALWLFARARVDAAILEVGLGGRLDAVNAFDADCAIVTSIDLDHLEYLGDTRERIGFEKAGIFRTDRAAVCGEPDLPRSVSEHARRIGARLLHVGRDFGYRTAQRGWSAWVGSDVFENLPRPALPGDHQLGNACVAVAALQQLRARLPFRDAHLGQGLARVRLAGRFQLVARAPDVVLDVAHNPHAARALAGNLAQQPCGGKTYAVFAMLGDKDIVGVIAALRACIDVWAIADLDEPRGASAELLEQQLPAPGSGAPVLRHRSPAQALRHTLALAAPADRIVVFGSFHTVAAVMRELGIGTRTPPQRQAEAVLERGVV